MMFLKIGHRGAAGHEPENTLRSFGRAIELGADMVELDAHICGTGEIVVIHDDTVNRTTDGSGPVKEKTLGELRSLDAGKGEMIPTLEEVLELLEGRAGVNIELKALGTAGPVHETLSTAIERSGWSLDDVFVSSFHLGELVAMSDLSEEVRTGVLVAGDPRDVLEFAESIKAYSINPYFRNTGEEFIKLAHGRGFKVFTWTVNEPNDIESMRAMGVDGVISDYPDRI